MTDIATAPSIRRPAPAKARILETALRRFYDDGIRQVGVDLLIAESKVTKATFYKHFGSKERLVLDYISAQREATLDTLSQALTADEEPTRGLRLMADAVVAQVAAPDYRGCPFQKAAAEFSDPTHPVRRVATEFHETVHALVVENLTRMQHPMPGVGADDLLLAYVGAMTWSHVGGVVAASSALHRCVERLIAASAH